MFSYLLGIDEEKREAKEKKDEGKARKAKEKHIKDKEKRKSKNGSVEASPQPFEAPALDPIPKLEPITAPGLSELVDTRAKNTDDSSVAESLAEGDLRSKSAAEEYKEPSAHSIESSFRPELRLSESRELERVLAEQPIQFEHASDKSDHGERRPLEPPTSATKEGNFADGEGVSSTSTLETTEAEIIAARVISSPVQPNNTTSIVSSTHTGDFSSIEPRNASANAPTRVGNPEATLFSEPRQTYPKENAESSTILGRNEPAESRDIQIIPTTEITISGPSLELKSPRGDSITSWLKSKLSRRSSKPAQPDNQDHHDVSAKPQLSDAAHTAAVAETKEGSHAHKGDDNSSIREVAIARKDTAVSANNQSTKFGAGLVSDQDKSHHSLSVSDENLRERPELMRAETGSSVGEEFEEARDHFDLEDLALPAISQGAGRGSSSPIRDSRFQENL